MSSREGFGLGLVGGAVVVGGVVVVVEGLGLAGGFAEGFGFPMRRTTLMIALSGRS